MARVTTVQKARAVPGERRCGRCGKDIGAGEKYYHWSNRAPGSRGGHKSNRCADHYPRPSETTGSPYKAAAYAVQEGLADDQLARLSFDELVASLDNAASDVRSECAEALEEAADNIEEGFGHETYQSQELRERAEAFEEWASTLEEASQEIDGLASQVEDECEVKDCLHTDCEVYQERYEEAMQLIDEASGACPE